MENQYIMSPYDETLPTALLKEAFEFRVEQANLTTERIYRDVVKQSKFRKKIPKAGEEKMRLAVDASDELIRDYKDGVVKLAKEKGHLVAQIKNNGKYGNKLPIKEELYLDGPSALDVQNALQLQAIQDALVTISEQIQAIDKNVKEVLVGQQNDRLALYYSGVSLYLEANSVSSPDIKMQLTTQALKTLSDSVFQLTLAIQTDIGYLARCEYDNDKKNKYNLICEKIDGINRTFMAIHQATMMRAAIYCGMGEMKAFGIVLQEYERFIKGTIVANAEMLSLCDTNDDGKETGIWKKRANLQLEVENIVQGLVEPKQIMYIECKGEKNHEGI